MAAQSTTAESSRSVPSPLGVVTDRQTYRNLAYLLLRFPLGIVYFTVLVTGLSLGLALTPVLVGIPVLGFVLALTGYLAAFEASLARRLLGVEASYQPVDPNEVAVVPYLKDAFTDPQTYVFVAYFFLTFGIGVACFTGVVVALTLSVTLAVAPFVYWLPWTNYELAVVGNEAVVTIDTLPEALVVSVVGIALFVLALHAFNVVARALGGLTRAVVSADGRA
jgi:hypothetical protein